MAIDNNQQPINMIGYNGGIGYPVPPNPVANIGGVGYNVNYNPYIQQQQFIQQNMNPQLNMNYNPQQVVYQQQNMNPQLNMNYNPQQVVYQQPNMNPQLNMVYNPQQVVYQQPNMNNGYYNQQYMGGYYNNGLIGYGQNPYLIQRQIEIQRIQYEEMQKQHSASMKAISRLVNRNLGFEVTDEYLSQYDPVVVSEKELERRKNWELMCRLNELSHRPLQNVLTPAQKIYNNNMIRDAAIRKEFPNDMSLVDFLDKAGSLYAEIVSERCAAKTKEINNLYNQSDYHKLLNMHNSPGSYYDKILNFTPSGDIEDFEITLPEHLKNSYTERRNKFFASILGG